MSIQQREEHSESCVRGINAYPIGVALEKNTDGNQPLGGFLRPFFYTYFGDEYYETLGVPSPFLLFRKPSNTQGKQPVEKNDG